MHKHTHTHTHTHTHIPSGWWGCKAVVKRHYGTHATVDSDVPPQLLQSIHPYTTHTHTHTHTQPRANPPAKHELSPPHTSNTRTLAHTHTHTHTHTHSSNTRTLSHT